MSKSMRCMTINASDVASLIGSNQFSRPSSSTQFLLLRPQLIALTRTHTSGISSTSWIRHSDKEMRRLMLLCAKYAMNNGYVTYLHECIRDRMRCLHLGDDLIAIHTRTEQLLKSLRCANGRDLEADAISAYVDTYNVSVTECNTRLLRRCHRFELGSPSVAYRLYIAGRIDAYDTSSGRIVEIKVRQYGFYCSLPPHERIQLFDTLGSFKGQWKSAFTKGMQGWAGHLSAVDCIAGNLRRIRLIPRYSVIHPWASCSKSRE